VFQYLAQSYDLTWHDIYLILSSTLLPEERQMVWDVARAHADKIHHTTPTHPVGAVVIPTEEPNWDYQTNGRKLRDQMVTCLVAGLKKAAQKVVNFDKLREIQQEKEENLASFLSQLTEVLQRYTKVDPETQDGTIIHMTHLISQSALDIRKKLKRLANGPPTPQAEILNVAFQVYNYQEDQQRADKERRDKAKFQMLAQAFQQRPPTSNSRGQGKSYTPPGPCFQCGLEGHWTHACPKPCHLPGPCPKCKQEDHWAMDCLSTPQSGGFKPPTVPPP
jgi:hypothetical protein